MTNERAVELFKRIVDECNAVQYGVEPDVEHSMARTIGAVSAMAMSALIEAEVALKFEKKDAENE